MISMWSVSDSTTRSTAFKLIHKLFVLKILNLLILLNSSTLKKMTEKKELADKTNQEEGLKKKLSKTTYVIFWYLGYFK